MRMKYEAIDRSTRRSINLSIASAAIDEAKALRINLSRLCERALKAEIAAVRDARWLEENLLAIEATNKWVEEHGLPLSEHRQF